MSLDVRTGWMILAGAAGLFVGGVMGKTTPSQTRGSEAPPVRTASSSRLNPSPPLRSKRDFTTLLNRLEQTGGIPAAGFEALEKMSSADLRALLIGLDSTKADRRNFTAYASHYKILQAAARELYLRDGRAAIEWGQSSGSEEIFLFLVGEAARKDPAMGSEWMLRLYVQTGIPGNQVIDAVWNGAAMRSSGELLAVEKQYGEISFSSIGGFAEDFDFATYIAGTESSRGLPGAIRYWTALDPDGVAEALRGQIGSKNPHWRDAYSTAFQVRADLAGDDQAAQWIRGIITELPEGQVRNLTVAGLAFEGMDESRTIALFDNLPSDADRTRLLEACLQRLGRYPGKAPEILETMMETLSLPASRREQLRGKLQVGGK